MRINDVAIQPKEVKMAVNEFANKLIERDGDKIISIRLYGSVAMGRYKDKESDVDLIVIGDDERIDNDILDLEVEVSLKYGVMLSVLFNTPKEIKKIREMGYPFVEEIEKGLKIYERS